MKQLIPVVNSDDHIFGNTLAPIELVEYGDYECPSCGRAYPIIKRIQKKLGTNMKFIFRNFPLSKIHPHSFLAALATEAAGLQNRFWEMHDIVFENQGILNQESIFQFAEILGLVLDQFRNDIHQQAVISKVEKDFESGILSGINRTPSFFVNGKKYDGRWGEVYFFQFLKGQLAKISISQV